MNTRPDTRLHWIREALAGEHPAANTIAAVLALVTKPRTTVTPQAEEELHDALLTTLAAECEAWCDSEQEAYRASPEGRALHPIG